MQFRKLIFILALFGFMVSASSARALQSGDLIYTVRNATVSIDGYAGSGGAVVIPATIDGLPVVSFGCEAFYDKAEITSITIPDSVTFFDNAIFKGCSGLTSITLPANLEYIGNWAFQDCSGLTGIAIPASVTFIGAGAFSPCTNLASIDVAQGNANYSSQDGVLYNKDKTTLIQCPTNKTGAFAIPHGVTKITTYAFFKCAQVSGVSIPDSVTSIEDQAFMQCTGLTTLELPSSVTSIGVQSFSLCTGLTGITVPPNMTSMGNEAFSRCTGLTGLTIPGGVTPGDFAFAGCTGLTSITLASGVTGIGSYAFKGCTGLIGITLPPSMTSIGEGAFYGCANLAAAYFEGNAPTMGPAVFDGCAKKFTVYHTLRSTGFTRGTWQGYPCKIFFPACPAKMVLGEENPALEQLRYFRDSNLAQSALGRKLIKIYYTNSEAVNAALDRSPELKAFTRVFLKVLAPLVGKKQE